MTAEEIRKHSEKLENQHPEHYEKAKIRILYEIAAQLAELNQQLASVTETGVWGTYVRVQHRERD